MKSVLVISKHMTIKQQGSARFRIVHSITIPIRNLVTANRTILIDNVYFHRLDFGHMIATMAICSKIHLLVNTWTFQKVGVSLFQPVLLIMSLRSECQRGLMAKKILQMFTKSSVFLKSVQRDTIKCLEKDIVRRLNANNQVSKMKMVKSICMFLWLHQEQGHHA